MHHKLISLKNIKFGMLSLAFLLVMVVFNSCSENPKSIQFKLHNTLQEDLKFMVSEVKSKSGDKYLLEDPYFIIEDLRFYSGDSARKISAWTQVNFFYFDPDSIDLFQRRKYRYSSSNRGWDRYSKQLLHEGQLMKKETRKQKFITL